MSITYITNGTTQDGFGARMHRAISTMIFTYYLRDKYDINFEYVHTPFSFEGYESFDLFENERGIACNFQYGDPYNEIKREGYLKRAVLWDKHVKYNGILITDIDTDNIQTIDVSEFGKRTIFDDISKKKCNNKLYLVKYLQKEFNSGYFDINMINKYLLEIKGNFMFEDVENNNVMLHIRRKDVYTHGSSRYLEDDYYLDILKKLDLVEDKYNVSIHTQRSGFDSQKYSKYVVVYDDEEEDYDLFKKMVSSKILVVGKSSFSYAAGLLNNNIVIKPPLIKGLDRWIDKKNLIL